MKTLHIASATIFLLLALFPQVVPAQTAAPQTNHGQALPDAIKAKAEMGDTEAQAQLGGMFSNGRGMEKDFVEGYAWLNLAARFDETSAKQRDALELRMTPQQIADAQERTKELRIAIQARTKPAVTIATTNAVASTNSLVKAVQPNGNIRETHIGGSIFKEERKRPLPNAFGKPDVFGRKVYAGYTELRFQGLTSDGHIILQLTEVDTHSTETTMSRSGQSHVRGSTDNRGVVKGTITHPAQGSTQVLPPNTTQFTFDPTKETELAIAGYRVRFLEFTQQKLKYSYAK
jgi:hypothetical protein